MGAIGGNKRPKTPDGSAVDDVASYAAFRTTTPLGAGATYSSAVFDARPFTQVQTHVYADTDGSVSFIFCDDADGLNVVRTITIPYTAANGFQLYSAPAFTPYVKYSFTDGGSGQTSFYFETKLLDVPLSAQILTAAGVIVDSMTASVTRSIAVGKDPGGSYRNVAVSEDGDLRVAVADPLTAFGELRTTEVRPVVQIDAVYGLRGEVETFVDASPGTGSVTATSGNFVCATGTGVGGYGVIRTRRPVRYRPGQGALYRFTAGFDSANATALSLQAAGAFNSISGFLVGYDGTQFGVMHRTDGAHEAHLVTVTAAATGAETVTLTLNSVGYSIPVTAGTVAHNATEIVTWLNANQTVWDAWQEDDDVRLFARNVGSLAGTYSVASTGTLTGTDTRLLAGATNTETWTYQASFNVDPLDGTGPSGVTLDKSKGNVYEIDLQYLGYGAVAMRLENPGTGRFFTFHRFEFPNSRTTPTLTNPSLKIGWIAASLGSTTNLTVYGASALGGIDGVLHPLSQPRSYGYQNASVGNTLESVFAIRVKSIFNSGLAQLGSIFPKLVFATAGGSKAVDVRLLLNPTFATTPNWQALNGGDESIVQYAEGGQTFTDDGREIARTIIYGSTSSGPLDLTGLAEQSIDPIHLVRGDVLCVAAVVPSGPATDVTASITFLED